MIELGRLSKRFGSFTAVDEIDLTVRTGEVLGFLGPNGAGKTTTMRIIAGFLTPTSGQARVCGFDVVRNARAARAHIGYLPEGAPVWPDMTPRAFLSFIARMRGFSGAGIARAVDAVVARTDLSSVLEQPTRTLSKGFRRRVGLAQALLHKPPVLLLDEPTDGLDPNQKHQVRTLIRDLADERTVIVSTHVLEEVDAVCTRVAIIDRGRIIVDETPTALAARSPRHGGVRLRPVTDLELARVALRGLEGAGMIMVEPGGVIFVSAATPGGDPEGYLALRVADRLRAANIAIAGMTVEHGRLDDVFRSLTLERTS